jgi:tetratricopeptide (TPR) repeat protein
MPFHTPRQPHISERDFATYQFALSVAYQLHDMMLGRLIELAGDETTIIVVSDHGFKTGMARRDQCTTQSIEDAVASHDSQAILVMRGPHIVRDDTIEGTTILDVAPTILALLGLPVGADMDGKPMLAAINEVVTVEDIPSWDRLTSDEWVRPSEPIAQIDQRLRYLIDLCYKESPSYTTRERIEQTRRENTYNLARSLLDAGETDRAIPLLEKLSSHSPYRADYNKTLFEAYNEVGRSREARAIVQRFWEIGERGPLVHLGFALISLSERKPAGALDHLNQMAKCNSVVPGMHVLAGQAYLRLREWDLAEKAFNSELAMNANSETAWGGLAVAAAGRQHYQAAAEHALQAVGLKPDYVAAHYQLGTSLYHLGRYSEAAQAFKRCIQIDPNFFAACRRLIALYEGPLADPGQALAWHQRVGASKKQRRSGGLVTPSARTSADAASSMSCE